MFRSKNRRAAPGDLGKAKRFEDLPPSAREYVLEMERRLGVPIPIVSVGQSREQTIIRGKIPGW